MDHRKIQYFTDRHISQCLNPRRRPFNWRYRPGSDLFLVYSQVWDTDDSGQLNRSLQN